MCKLTSALLTLTLVLATAATGLAQGISLGGHVGIGLATLEGDVEGLDSRTGFLVGGFVGIDLPGGLFSLKPELQFAQKGAEEEEDGETGKIKLNYLQIMVPATLVIPTQGVAVQPRVYAGPRVGLELSCDFEAEADGASAEIPCEDLGLETKSVDFGLILGAGVDIPAGPGAVTIDGRYDLGLSNINDTEGDDTDVKNRGWQFLAGYAIHIGV